MRRRKVLVFRILNSKGKIKLLTKLITTSKIKVKKNIITALLRKLH